MRTLLAFVLVCFTGVAAAQCACSTGVFVDVRAGQSNLNAGIYNGNSIGYSGDLGYRFQLSDSFEIGPEVGYTWLGKFNPRSSLFHNLAKAHVSGGNLGVNARFKAAQKISILARAGVFHSGPTAMYITPTGTFVTVDGSSTKYYAGAGVGLDVLPNISIGADYTYYRVSGGTTLNPQLWAAFAEVRF